MTASAHGLPALEAKIAFLRKRTSYPEDTRSVQLVETHMSLVFLTERFAYKLKKPVLFPFLDFSTPARRKQHCDEEIRLNRRLAPGVYIGVVPLTLDRDGALAIGGDGAPVDWLVKMHRIPAQRMLDYAIRHDSYTRAQIEEVAQMLSVFYRDAEPAAVTAAEYLARFETDVAENLRELAVVDSIVDPPAVQRVHGAQLIFLQMHRDVLERRAREQRIVEAHGDLRPEHVVLGPQPQIIDRLEFNQAFRTLDPVDELAYFSVECELLGAGAIGTMLYERYLNETGDAAPTALVDFYKCYRACLRAKLAVWHLRESTTREPEHWVKHARQYLAIAGTYAKRLSQSYVAMSATSESPV